LSILILTLKMVEKRFSVSKIAFSQRLKLWFQENLNNLGRIRIQVLSDPVRIRIRMDVRVRIRIRTKSVRIHNTARKDYTEVEIQQMYRTVPYTLGFVDFSSRISASTVQHRTSERKGFADTVPLPKHRYRYQILFLNTHPIPYSISRILRNYFMKKAANISWIPVHCTGISGIKACLPTISV